MPKQPVGHMRTCRKCGWVHFSMSRRSAVKAVKDFNKFFDTLSKQEQEDYYGGHGASLDLYEKCNLCGGPHTNFRKSRKGDCPDGCTIGPIIYEPRKVKGATKKNKK